jgi:hypothetical protein
LTDSARGTPPRICRVIIPGKETMSLARHTHRRSTPRRQPFSHGLDPKRPLHHLIRRPSTSVPEFARLFAGGNRIRTTGPALVVFFIIGRPLLNRLGPAGGRGGGPGALVGRGADSLAPRNGGDTAPAVSAFPDSAVESACTSTFSRSHDVLWVATDSASK